MAVPDATGHDANDGFLQNAHLTYIIPFSTKFNPDEALREGEGSFESKLAGIELRDQLFFDETVDVYLILRTQCADEQTLRLHLRRLVVSLDAQIVNSHSQDLNSPPASEIIHSGGVEDVEDAFIVPDESEDGIKFVYAVWKLSVFLGRPRIRLQLPSVVFSATAGLKQVDLENNHDQNDGYMLSCVPSGMNMLDSFANDPMLGDIKPHLSAQRVNRVAPATQSKDSLRRIPGLQSLKLKIFPLLHCRVRFSRPNTSPPSPALIALVETDFTPYFDCEASLNQISLEVTNGNAEDLNNQPGMRLPLSCVAHDHLTFLYKLTPSQLDLATTKAPIRDRDLIITIEIDILVRPDGEPNPCTPKLSMTWITPLDFTLPVNPGFGQPMTQPIQRSHRPSQLSISGGVDSQPLVSPSVIRPDALPSLEAAARSATETSIPDFGITLTFTGPEKPVYVGEEFVWTVFVVNRSRPTSSSLLMVPGHLSYNSAAAVAAASQSRKLMLLVVPHRRRNEGGAAAGALGRPMLRGSPTTGQAGKKDLAVADAVLDENVVYAMQKAGGVDNAEVVCLSADVRVGPLAPNACSVVELRFLALREGVVGVEAVKVVDLGSQEHVDVRELPLVVVRRRRE
ncbi:TRAPP trafficking subunit Trs65-domain-containing protein [Triangularia verruculosa]|uniref:TRAPP trafficking subunit Trs65-domain-containing protein n=1 Tax=Triangularia verruculosa TaxID=2587418 RepID=A0AAN6XK77_9PEZI|nr:TRAPP trafficking subunit Trs65-domain-containing protein [Triangularia verruculosa]